MTREQLKHVIRAVADITGSKRLVVIGSRATLLITPQTRTRRPEDSARKCKPDG